VTDTAVAFLGAIALATVVMAAIQVGAIIYGARLARRTEQMVARFERDLAPLIERMTAVGGEAARAASLATLQVQRVDRLITDLSEKIDHTVTIAQRTLTAPARESAALRAALEATVGTLRDLRRQRRAARLRADDDDALFIG
jgi:hypothetical protein